MIVYNEIDRFASEWLRALVDAGHVSSGDVNTTSIVDLRADDCAPTTHLFAGIGGWDYALQLAGWHATEPVWTGSCPCQPFSNAGSRRGTDDERHLWPHMRRLIGECRPSIVFGEQVAKADGRDWLAVVRSELEALGYAVGAADLCAAGVGAPHARQRLYWGAARLDDAARAGRRWRESRADRELGGSVPDGGRVGDADRARLQSGENVAIPKPIAPGDARCWVGNADGAQLEGRRTVRSGTDQRAVGPPSVGDAWSDAELVECNDFTRGRVWRLAQPGSFPLADGIPARVGRLRGYGNAIVPQVAAVFVTSFMESL